MPGLFILIALFCVPPVLSLRATLRAVRHARDRGRPGMWALLGLAVSLGALVFNAGVILRGLVLSGMLTIELGASHALALGLAWICFWIWIVVAIALRRRRRSVY